VTNRSLLRPNDQNEQQSASYYEKAR